VANGTCSIEGCVKDARRAGLCAGHSHRLYRYGDPLGKPARPSLADRFWAKVDKLGPDGYHSQTGANLGPCWLWTASVDSYGYGQFSRSRRPVKAYRVSYELLHGPVPKTLELDHLCRCKLCVRPSHLEAVPHRENLLRGESPAALAARKTHCIRGHAFDDENTVDSQGFRCCLECRRAYRRTPQARAKKRAWRRQQRLAGRVGPL
jgi:hypothetical protein